MQNVTAFVTDTSCDELHCFYLRTFFSFTSSSFSSKDLSRCWGITSLKPFCRARNWASMPCRKRQFTYNLQQTYEREEGEEAQRESVRLVCQIQMCDHDTDLTAMLKLHRTVVQQQWTNGPFVGWKWTWLPAACLCVRGSLSIPDILLLGVFWDR